jgi:putative glutamine amidotransferase
VLLTGGEDVDPALYRARPVCVERVDRTRDELELALVAAARQRGLPLLGICRGAQVLAVALGGSLVQDVTTLTGGDVRGIRHRAPDAEGGDTEHAVNVEPESLLARLLGATRLRVNSHHHQAVATLPAPARIVARADDGAVEALELPGPSFLLGVQWHPERFGHASSQAIRDAFLSAARRTARQTGRSDSSSGNDVTGSRITSPGRAPDSK